MPLAVRGRDAILMMPPLARKRLPHHAHGVKREKRCANPSILSCKKAEARQSFQLRL
jgi:hypothetical protein